MPRVTWVVFMTPDSSMGEAGKKPARSEGKDVDDLKGDGTGGGLTGID